MPKEHELDLYLFIEIGADAAVPYPFWIAKYPVTNSQYERFLEAPDFAAESHWRGFLKFDENCQPMGDWGERRWNWLHEAQKDSHLSPDGKRLIPRYWQDKNFGIAESKNPVVGVTGYEASAYCQWLRAHWDELPESRANPELRPRLVRLPLETEWVAAAGGDDPEERFPWDAPGVVTTDPDEILRRANVWEHTLRSNSIDHTTPVDAYPDGASPHGVMDMAGNAMEWQANFFNKDHDKLAVRGASCKSIKMYARLSGRTSNLPFKGYDYYGFRVVGLPG